MKKHKPLIILYLIDLLIYSAAFIVIYVVRRGSISISSEYISNFIFYLFSVVLSAVITQKFQFKNYHRYVEAARAYLIAFILTLGLLTLFTNYFNPPDISRRILISSLAVSLIAELFWLRLRLKRKIKESRPVKVVFSSYIFFTETILIFAVVLYAENITLKNFNLLFRHVYLLLDIIISWFVSVLLTYHFLPLKLDKTYWASAWGRLKSYIIMFFLNLFVVYALRLEGEERNLLLLIPALYSLLSFVVFTFIYTQKLPSQIDEVNIRIMKATTYKEIESISDLGSRNYKHKFDYELTCELSFGEKLKDVYLKKMPEVFSFISERIDLRTINPNKAVVFRSSDLYNVEVLRTNYIDLLLNIHEVNDIRRLNVYFIEVNKRLSSNGIFIGRFEPKRLRYKRFLAKYPYALGRIFYFFDFIWKRVFPKMPITQKLYFGLTKGRDRALPLAECLGRLCYCGFEILDIKEIHGFYYFIVKKVNAPLEHKNPSYGPFFKMPRVGKDGKIIEVYKMRTMHPYSEYLQKFIFDRFKLKDGGKFQHDFRITSWGGILRKMWLDELPMLINFLKGDLKLVGVRPLSMHYLSLYTKELQEKRKRVKPGLIPPFYYDLPKTLEEIMRSEDRYLEKYFKHPLATDIKYFFKCMSNILLKSARSS